jgi:hypothetical protein
LANIYAFKEKENASKTKPVVSPSGLNLFERFKQIIEQKQGQKIKDRTPPLDQ